MYKQPKSEYQRTATPPINAEVYLRQNGIFLSNYITPQSAYFSIMHEGVIFHVFDARRMTLGRIACRAAIYLRGKHKPIYDPIKEVEIGDRVIVVNASDVWVTGNKRITKIYRHHTRYAGGLHEITLKDLMRKNPLLLFKKAIGGMMPKTKTRYRLLERLHVHAGQYHNHQAQGIPQFINQPLPDPMKILGIDDLKNPEKTKVIAKFSLTGEKFPNDFDHLPVEIDEHYQNPQKWAPIKNKKKIERDRAHSMKVYRRYREYK